MKIKHFIIDGLTDRDLDDEIKLAPRQEFKVTYLTLPLPPPMSDAEREEFYAAFRNTDRCGQCTALWYLGRGLGDMKSGPRYGAAALLAATALFRGACR